MEGGTKPELNDNPFEQKDIARIWTEVVENEKGQFRDKYIYPLLREWAEEGSKENILDLGAGQGIASTILKGKKYTGVEPSEELVKRAAEQYGAYGDFVRGSAYELPFKEKTFDGVFAINVWFHLQNLQQAGAELRRVMRDNAEALIINPNPEEYALWKTWYSNVREFEGGFEGSVQVPGAILPRNIFYTHTQEEITQSFEREGLRLVDTQPFAPLESGTNIFRYDKLTQ
jgi:ubiquinone/menaquinone biosynthesis C-methylase UbiE